MEHNIVDLIKQDIDKLTLINSSKKILQEYTPFAKIINNKNKRDGRIVSEIKYSNIYSNNNLLLPDTNNTINPNILVDIEKYEITRRKTKFAIPLADNGINDLRVLNNAKYHINTFNYKRYASQDISSANRYTNPLYNTDISKETIEQKQHFFQNITNDNRNLYNGIIEDMYYLSGNSNNFNDNKNTEIDREINYIWQMQKYL